MKKKGKSEAETFAGAAILFIILFVLIVSGVFFFNFYGIQ